MRLSGDRNKKQDVSMKAFMCHNCSKQVRLINSKIKHSDMIGLLNQSENCCNKTDFAYQYTRKI